MWPKKNSNYNTICFDSLCLMCLYEKHRQNCKHQREGGNEPLNARRVGRSPEWDRAWQFKDHISQRKYCWYSFHFVFFISTKASRKDVGLSIILNSTSASKSFSGRSMKPSLRQSWTVVPCTALDWRAGVVHPDTQQAKALLTTKLAEPPSQLPRDFLHSSSHILKMFSK